MRTPAGRAGVRTGLTDVIVRHGEVAPTVPAFLLALCLDLALASFFLPLVLPLG